ncbi:unnamed protein product [Owenia fusiformis]|uniref:PR domain zinc finger protein 10 n=1 Tax=Owenia fusiformis TaxID=6347 RepID=A0A8S4PXK9_OWEFU|nr:unnamed protein product [Owenia fusiformis]
MSNHFETNPRTRLKERKREVSRFQYLSMEPNEQPSQSGWPPHNQHGQPNQNEYSIQHPQPVHHASPQQGHQQPEPSIPNVFNFQVNQQIHNVTLQQLAAIEQHHYDPGPSQSNSEHIYQAVHSTFNGSSPANSFSVGMGSLGSNELQLHHGEAAGTSDHSTSGNVQSSGIDGSFVSQSKSSPRVSHIDSSNSHQRSLAVLSSASASNALSMASYLADREPSTSEATPLMKTIHDDDDDDENQEPVSSLNLDLPTHNVPQEPQIMLETYQDNCDSNEPDTTGEHLPAHFSQQDMEAESISCFPATGVADSNHHGGSVSTVELNMGQTVGEGRLIASGSLQEAELMLPQPGPHVDSTPNTSEPESALLPRKRKGKFISSMMQVQPSTSDQSNKKITDDQDKENRKKRHYTRKSARLTAEQKAEMIEYVSRPYNVNELWCDDCMRSYKDGCPTHSLQLVYDKVVLSRAWSSLPPMLLIFRLASTAELGVFAKRDIAKRTQFGPFCSDIVPSKEQLTNPNNLLLMVDREDGSSVFYDAVDENKCNWMMFVRPAKTYAEQNVVAYQHGTDIYFSAIKHIPSREELKVWYAPHYAERLGIKTHEITEADRQALKEDEKWQCFECTKKFQSSGQLMAHLAEHEDTDILSDDDNDPDVTEDSLAVSGNHSNRSSKDASEGESNNKASDSDMGVDNGVKETSSTTFQSWKKKKTSIYLNRQIKRARANTVVKRSIKSLYKKREAQESGVNEWLCTHCDLTFDNSSLLNLHTLTHAAEDVGYQESKQYDLMDHETPAGMEVTMETSESEAGGESNVVVLVASGLQCPVCHSVFESKRHLVDHVSTHAKAKPRNVDPKKPFSCLKCTKSFNSNERLIKHQGCHVSDEAKPLQCEHCKKRFVNNSALSCHLKTHSNKKYYECPLCYEGFDTNALMRSHGEAVHCMPDGSYYCQECPKSFRMFDLIKKHARVFHPRKQYACPECQKLFPRTDKLRLHMLRHSNHREFMCDLCGRQFKRKDKLKEHVARLHVNGALLPPKIAVGDKAFQKKKFEPQVLPSEFERFVYKCHTCLLGFKRRGMLVNHMAKRHPDTKLETVPELNLPILKAQKDFFCQYCEKVYKSSSKRKAHIIKNHPGAELPLMGRTRKEDETEDGVSNRTFSQTVGSVTTVPHPCELCHKQYASRAKLNQHQRMHHMGNAPAVSPRKIAPPPQTQVVSSEQNGQLQQSHAITLTNQGFVDLNQLQNAEIIVQLQQPNSDATPIQAADLLTQAMSEITQSLSDYKPQVVGVNGQAAEFHISPRIAPAPGPSQSSNNGQQIQVQTGAPGQQQQSTIDISQLGQVQFQQQQLPSHLAQIVQGVAAAGGQAAGQVVQVSSSEVEGVPVTVEATLGQNGVTYVVGGQRVWTNFNQNVRQ